MPADTSVLRLKRFSVVQRLWHFGLIVLFMFMGVTGLAWMFIETPFGQLLAAPFGDYRDVLYWHRIAGLVFLAGFALHILYLLTRIDWSRVGRSLLGPDSLVFQGRDLKGMIQHVGWIFGLAKAPAFERWSWWEKFDYWAVWWGLLILGVTGLMLYDPVLTSEYMPGWLLNVVLWVHRIEALLAMGHIFIVHFFVENFRPTALPLNAAMFDGTMTLAQAREEHPAWVARLEREGRLRSQLVPEPPVVLRIAYFLSAYAIIALGLFLLVFMVMNLGALTLF